MPGFDGTGPDGQGAMTGRGLGPCGAGMARGYGRGAGMGRGRGFGRGFRFAASAADAGVPEPQDARVEELAGRLERIEAALETLTRKLQ